MTTILRLERKDYGIRIENAAGTIRRTLPIDHEAARLFPADRNVVYAKCQIVATGDIVILGATKARQYLETVRKSKEPSHAPSA